MTLILIFLHRFVSVLMFLLFARAISSWFVRDLSNPIVRFLFEVTEPMISPVRNFLQNRNLGGGMFDFSFIIVYLLLMMIQTFIATMI
ncbi:MAG: YggT family protein [Clostridia bacterium]|nr:YggT family protein [Clostridia bacterium]